MKKYKLWTGLITPTVGKSSKYSVRQWRGEWRISVVLNTSSSVITLFSKDGTEIIEKIIDFLISKGSQLGGPFYITHNKDVIKPYDGENGLEYYHIGKFPNAHFRFTYRGETIDNKNDYSLNIGDEYPYPPVGIQYQYSRPNMIITGKRINRSDWSKEEVIYTLKNEQVTQMLINLLYKGTNQESGRFYVNEHGLVFKPVLEDNQTNYKYITSLDFKNINWFEGY